MRVYSILIYQFLNEIQQSGLIATILSSYCPHIWATTAAVEIKDRSLDTCQSTNEVEQVLSSRFEYIFKYWGVTKQENEVIFILIQHMALIYIVYGKKWWQKITDRRNIEIPASNLFRCVKLLFPWQVQNVIKVTLAQFYKKIVWYIY